MLTNIKNIFDIKEKEIGYLSQEKEVCKHGEKYPIYIPRLMPKITFGEPVVKTVSSNGTLVFKNSPECRVLTDRILHIKNSLSIPFERNKSWTDDQINVYKNNKDEVVSKTISAKTQVICNCKTDLISDMTFSND